MGRSCTSGSKSCLESSIRLHLQLLYSATILRPDCGISRVVAMSIVESTLKDKHSDTPFLVGSAQRSLIDVEFEWYLSFKIC